MKQVGAFLVCCVLMLTGITIIFEVNGSTAEPSSEESVAYTIHLPIKIDSNADFDATHGVTGGNGTGANPWIINNLEINRGGATNCIYIGNTTDYFIILNCNFISDSKAAIECKNIQQGIIDNCTFNCPSIGGVGVVIWDSFNISIDNNQITAYHGGIILYTCENMSIQNNNIEGINVLAAIGTLEGKNLLITNNLITDSLQSIFLSGVYNSNISKNTMMNTQVEAILIRDSSYNINIFDNILKYNGVGISLNGTSGLIKVYGNTFILNSLQAYDWLGFYMDWNSTDEQKGNYWDDYNGTDVNHDGIGDTPYIIDADSQDYFPLMEPFGGVPPLSDVNAISPYWNSAFPKNITATASDEHNEVYNVTLWHRFSEDNVTWGVWTTFGLDDAVPWSWSYGFPYGQGFYEFYSVANDSSSNMEIATQTADASCLYNELPVISLVSPQNNSLIKPGSIVTLDVSDGNLNHVDYSEDGGVKNTLDGSYLIDTSNWTDGIHTIEVFAIDKANHSSFAQFEFTIDGTLPTIVSTTPADNAAEVSPKVIITIQFSEAMNKTSVESAFEISGLPYDTTSNFTWNANGTMLIASINSDFDNNETYHVTINATAKDIVGNNLTYYDFTFTTWVDTDLDGIPDSTDTDDDGDGVLDAIDAFPLDPNEWVDTDIDGIGDNADTDDDGDGVPDTEDFAPLDPEVTTEPNSTNGINGYIWIGLCVIIIIIFMVIFLIRKKHSPSNENKGLDAQSKESK